MLSACTAKPTGLGKSVTVGIDSQQFNLEPATTAPQRHQGLSDRPSIAEDGGMIFIFPDSRIRRFVMRKCLVPIDILFVDGNARVVSMHRMKVEPYDRPERALKQYSSQYPVRFAIELKGGTLNELDVERGQELGLPLKRLKRAVE